MIRICACGGPAALLAEQRDIRYFGTGASNLGVTEKTDKAVERKKFEFS